jgi:hypothetical protein
MEIKTSEKKLELNIREIDNIHLRRNICKTCPEKKRMLHAVDYCGQCGCVIFLKTAITSEKCPLDKW